MHDVVFYGELPPFSLNGVSVSNDINIKCLERNRRVNIVLEKVNLNLHKKFSATKIFAFIHTIFSLIKVIRSTRSKYLYTTLSSSIAGQIKSIIICYCFRILNPTGIVVVHIHRGDFNFNETNIFRRLVLWVLLKQIDKVIVLSKIFISGFKLPNSVNFYIVPNTVHLSSVKSVYCKSELDINILCIANYVESKGHLDVVNAINLINSNINLHVDFRGDESGPLFSMIKEYESKKFQVNGLVSSSSKFNLMRNSDFLILASHNEGQPLVILEAMMIGLPVIASDVGCIREMLGDSYEFIFSPGDTKELSRLVLKLIAMDDPKVLGKYLIDRFKNIYSEEAHDLKFLEVFCD